LSWLQRHDGLDFTALFKLASLLDVHTLHQRPMEYIRYRNAVLTTFDSPHFHSRLRKPFIRHCNPLHSQYDWKHLLACSRTPAPPPLRKLPPYSCNTAFPRSDPPLQLSTVDAHFDSIDSHHKPHFAISALKLTHTKIIDSDPQIPSSTYLDSSLCTYRRIPCSVKSLNGLPKHPFRSQDDIHGSQSRREIQDWEEDWERVLR